MDTKRVIAALCCLGIALAFIAHAVARITAVSPVIAGADEPPVIVIDAGHGGFDGGASDNNTVEKDINLTIAKKLYEVLTLNGFKSVLTRDEDVSLEDEGLQTIRKKKNSDIHNRMKLADSFPDCILLSIHQNKYTESKYYGAQVFYGPKNAQSAQMGEIFQKNMIEMLDPTNTRQTKPCTDSVYLIHNAQMPALLIECGFLSNPDEAARLRSDEYQNRVAFTLFCSILEFLSLREDYERVPV